MLVAILISLLSYVPCNVTSSPPMSQPTSHPTTQATTQPASPLPPMVVFLPSASAPPNPWFDFWPRVFFAFLAMVGTLFVGYITFRYFKPTPSVLMLPTPEETNRYGRRIGRLLSLLLMLCSPIPPIAFFVCPFVYNISIYLLLALSAAGIGILATIANCSMLYYRGSLSEKNKIEIRAKKGGGERGHHRF